MDSDTAMLAGITSLRDLNVDGRRVFVRVDFNVPLSGAAISDDTRIRAALPTIRHLMEHEARVILASHVGRPKGEPDPSLSLEPVGTKLAELLDAEVLLTDDCLSDAARKIVADMRDGQVALLENLRFHAAEEQDDTDFAKALAKLADVYVNDAFGVSHRAHASVHALPALMRERGMGLLLERELDVLSKLRDDPSRPFVAVLGGAKVGDKLGVLEALIDRVDALLIGGAMANTFLAAAGHDMKRSKVETERLALARSLVQRAEARKVRLVLPADVVIAPDAEAASGITVEPGRVESGHMALDIGPATVEAFTREIRRAASVFWNGPLGLFERQPFAKGTLAVAHAVAECGAFTVVGGGDSVAAVQQAGVAGRIGHVSTGGGASLELLEGRSLPGVEALR